MLKFNQPQVIFIICLLVLLLGLANAQYKSQNHSTSEATEHQTPKLLFSDEFEGSTLDGKKWTTCYDWANDVRQGCTNFGNDESEWYTPQQVQVAGGKLELTAVKRNTKGLNKTGSETTYPYNSGMISTGRGSMNAPARWVNAYGYYEIRLKAPEGKAVWPAFWLVPEGTEWPPEIDIVEILGDRPDELLHTYFWKDPQGKQAKDSLVYKAPQSLANRWHTYGMEWQENKIAWYLDGKQVRHINSTNVPREKMEMIINLAIGGRLPGQPDESTPEVSKLEVDYVRVYNAKP